MQISQTWFLVLTVTPAAVMALAWLARRWRTAGRTLDALLSEVGQPPARTGHPGLRSPQRTQAAASSSSPALPALLPSATHRHTRKRHAPVH